MRAKHAVLLAGGVIFGFGLAMSGMTKPEVILDFLQLDDLGLLLVMAAAVVISALAFNILSHTKRKAPLTGLPYGRRLYPLDKNIVIGGVIFGVGWGFSGVCPGAAYASLAIGNYPIVIALAGMLLGAYWFKASPFSKG